MKPDNPVIWSIAGSDSAAGRGIQADIKTASALGVHCCTVVSAVTAQNSHEVTAIQAVDTQVFNQQLSSLWLDMPARVIKIGMLATGEQVESLTRFLKQIKPQSKMYVIYDPVLTSSSGTSLFPEKQLNLLSEKLLPHVDLLTPNLPELLKLSGTSNKISAISKLRKTGCKAIFAKGGHAEDRDVSIDVYHDDNNILSFSSSRIAARVQGTGCLLSTAIASAIALNYPIEDALSVAKACVNKAIKSSQQFGSGTATMNLCAWPEDIEDFPQVDNLKQPNRDVLKFKPCPQSLGIYPVVESIDWLEKLLGYGIKTVQLRAKDLPQHQAEPLVIQAIALGRQYQARVFINDYWQLAIKHSAYGVHLGQEDLQTANLNQIAEAGIRLGLSTHGYFELLTAMQLRPSYVALGHIFPTQTKEMPSIPQGVERLKRYQMLCEDLPTVAIGGIDHAKAERVAQTGVGSIAMVTAITEADNWQHSVDRFQQILERA